MNGGRVLVDTNVLVYVFDPDEPEKQAIARHRTLQLAEEGNLILSTQILQEFFVTVTRKLAKPLPLDSAEAAVREWARHPVTSIDATLVLQAIALSRKHKISLWDALILQSALDADCQTLLTEDLQHGWTVQGVCVENPFRGVRKPLH